VVFSAFAGRLLNACNLPILADVAKLKIALQALLRKAFRVIRTPFRGLRTGPVFNGLFVRSRPLRMPLARNPDPDDGARLLWCCRLLGHGRFRAARRA
jgi:hypothetical protein